MRGRMVWRALALSVPVLGLVAGAWAASPAADRLDRFRAVAAAGGTAAVTELEGLVDAEVLDNLVAGGVFASTAFLQERLDGFAAAWGGVSLRAVMLGSLVAVVFRVTDGFEGSTVRVYARQGDHAALMARLAGPGRPSVQAFPATSRGEPQLLVAWEGAPSGLGTSPLRLDLLRRHGDALVVAWSTAGALGEDLTARSWSVHGREVRVRHEEHYPGWVPGCERQTEAEEVYRPDPVTGDLGRVRRQEYEGWHRALRRDAGALLEALASGDRPALARSVPDPALRSRLPRALAPDTACDAPEGRGPRSVSVPAVEGPERRPWILVFVHDRGHWRLRDASPVLQ